METIIYICPKFYVTKWDDSGLVDVYCTTTKAYMGTVDGLERAKEKFNA